jgi:hypothetical protein
MKYSILLLFCLSIINCFSQVCLITSECNYQFPSETNYDVPVSQTIKIKVYPHSIIRTNGIAVPDNDIINALDRLNTTFSSGNIEFLWDCNINYIYSDDLNTNAIFDIYEKHSDGLDYYFFTNEATSGRSGEANGVGCETQIRLGGLYPNIGTSYIDSDYVSHEVGHVFGLFHTHADRCEDRPIELIDQSNCLIGGDMLYSTPADPGYLPNSNTPICIYEPENMDVPFTGNCTLEPDTNYMPDLTNLMSYFHPNCITGKFNTEQFEVMRYNINALPEISKSIIPNGDIVVNAVESIDQYKSYFNNITIKDGATLTINANISMAAGKSIIIERGGELVINNATITNHCGDQWLGIKIEGDISNGQGGLIKGGEVYLNNATLSNAKIGIDNFYKQNFDILNGGLVDVQNSNINNCDIGIYLGPYAYTNPLLQREDPSYIFNTSFDNCTKGIQAGFTSGAKIDLCTFSNGHIGIESNTAKLDIVNNIFDASISRGYLSHYNWPTFEGSIFKANTFLSNDYGIQLLGTANINPHIVEDNTFTSSVGFYNDGITEADIFGNSFIGNQEGYYGEHLGEFSLYNNWNNLYSGNSFGSSTLGVNNQYNYSANCFEYISTANIELLDNSSIRVNQGESEAEEAGNCFDLTVPTLMTGINTDFFNYHILENTPITECEHPGDPGSNNWEVFDDAQNELDDDCGAGIVGGTPPYLFNCIIPGTLEDQLSMRDSLLSQILSIEQDTTLSPIVSKWLIQRLMLCLRKVKGSIIRYYFSQNDGIESAINFLKGTQFFEDHALAYGLMMDNGDITSAYFYLDTLSYQTGAEEEFIESQLIYNEYLRVGNPVNESDLTTITYNASQRNPYACFSQCIYYQLTDSLIIKPIVHLVSPNPRSRQDASETLSVIIFPNPVVEDVIYIDLNHKARVEIFGLSGKMYLRQYFDAGYNQMSLLKINETVLLIKCTDMLGVESIHKIVKI